MWHGNTCLLGRFRGSTPDYRSLEFGHYNIYGIKSQKLTMSLRNDSVSLWFEAIDEFQAPVP